MLRQTRLFSRPLTRLYNITRCKPICRIDSGAHPFVPSLLRETRPKGTLCRPGGIVRMMSYRKGERDSEVQSGQRRALSSGHEEIKLEEELYDMRNLLVKFKYGINLTDEDYEILLYQLKVHRKHRIVDYQKQVLRPLYDQYICQIEQIEKIKQLSYIPTPQMLNDQKMLKYKIKKLETIDTHSVNFLDRSQKFADYF